MERLVDKDVLHLITSNVFFNNMVVESFEKIYPERNDFVFCGSGSNTVTEIGNGRYVSFFSADFNQILTKEYKLIIVHHLNFYKACLLNKVKPVCPVVWICWGADAFDLPRFRNQFYSKMTINRFYPIILKSSIIQYLKTFHKFFIYKKNKNHEIYRAIKNFDYIATLLPGDFDLISSKINTLAKHLNFNYYNTESFQDFSVSNNLKFNNILVGNSSTLSNNHIDILNILRWKEKLPGKIIVPLVYGDIYYRKMLVKSFTKYFKGNIDILIKPLPSDEYYQILRTCGFAIMNHIRQQALGNILPLLGFGTKIFLNSTGHLYQYLLQNGFVVFSIEQDLIDESAFVSLTDDQVERNKTCLRKIRSSENYADKMIEFKQLL